MSGIPIYKHVNRQWKVLPKEGDDVTIKDPKLKQGYLGNLSKKTALELEEILKRNGKVLENKSLLAKLKDRGKNLQAQQIVITKAYEEVKKKEVLAKEVDQNDIHGFEWTGSLTNNVENGKTVTTREDPVDDDGDDMDPLELMAHHSAAIDHRQSRASRCTEEDPASTIAKELERLEIQDMEQSVNSRPTKQFGETRNEMFQKKFEQNGPARVSFKPYRPSSNPKPIPGIFVKKRPVVLKPAISISSEESQRLEKDYLDKQKARDLKLTIEGLARPNRVSNMCQLPTNPVGGYRDANMTKHILDSDEEEEDDQEFYNSQAGNFSEIDDDNDY